MGTKAHLNKLEIMSMKASQMPSVIKLSFSQLKKMMQDDDPKFDGQENMEQAIIDTTKQSNTMIRELSKLKNEYFQASQDIVNKDLNSVKLS
jgi:hypothetical protein